MDVFYPLPYWDIIVQGIARQKPGPISSGRLNSQETVFMRTLAHLRGLTGLMQVLVPTGMLNRKGSMAWTDG